MLKTKKQKQNGNGLHSKVSQSFSNNKHIKQNHIHFNKQQDKLFLALLRQVKLNFCNLLHVVLYSLLPQNIFLTKASAQLTLSYSKLSSNFELLTPTEVFWGFAH